MLPLHSCPQDYSAKCPWCLRPSCPLLQRDSLIAHNSIPSSCCLNRTVLHSQTPCLRHPECVSLLSTNRQSSPWGQSGALSNHCLVVRGLGPPRSDPGTILMGGHPHLCLPCELWPTTGTVTSCLQPPHPGCLPGVPSVSHQLFICLGGLLCNSAKAHPRTPGFSPGGGMLPPGYIKRSQCRGTMDAPGPAQTMWTSLPTCKESGCIHGAVSSHTLPICTLWKPLLPSPRLASWAGALYPEGRCRRPFPARGHAQRPWPLHPAACRSYRQPGRVCGFPDKPGLQPLTSSPLQGEEPFVFLVQGVSLILVTWAPLSPLYEEGLGQMIQGHSGLRCQDSICSF